MDIFKRWMTTQKTDLAKLKQGKIPGPSDDGFRLMKPVEYDPSEKRHRIGVLSLILVAVLAMIGTLAMGSRTLSYTDASNGYTVGYSAKMQRVENSDGFAMFVDGEPEFPRSLIAARGQLNGAEGFYEQRPADERATFWEEYTAGAQTNNPDIDAVINLEELNLIATSENFTFLPDQEITNETANDDGSINTEVTKFKPEGIRTKFTGRSQASGEPIEYAGEHILYVLANGRVATYVVMAEADIWADSRDELMATAGLN